MNAPTLLAANALTASTAKIPRQRIEPAVALALTLFVAILLACVALNAGGLWRDEANSINLAQMPTLKELWHNLRFDSCPLLWPLLLRVWTILGLAGTDLGIRLLGLMVGLSFLASLWLCVRWIGGRAPVISIALLGSLPAFINIVGANRAYGLASTLLLLNFGAVWRVVQLPSRDRVIIGAVAAILFVHCIYYNGVFLYAMLFAAAIVVIQRRDWKTLSVLGGIGAVTGLSMLIYVPMILKESSHAALTQVPLGWWNLWTKLNVAVTQPSGTQGSLSPDLRIWVWIVLLLLGVVTTIVVQGRWTRQSDGFHFSRATQGSAEARAHLALYGSLSMLCGIVGYGCFLLKVQLPTESWYYVEALTLCAISIEGTLGRCLEAFRPWGVMRICCVILIMSWGGSSSVDEALTRRTNIDVIAAKLRSEARQGDLVLVYGPWEGITFERYYQGVARWMTVPPIDSHKVHRADLVIQKINDSQPLASTFVAIDETLASGHAVWVVGQVELARKALPLPHSPNRPIKWGLGAYFGNWSAQVMAHVLAQSRPVATGSLSLGRPVNKLEDLPLMRFVKNRSPNE
jgi:hypothetical protein